MNIDQARLDANWRAITIELDAPRASRPERALRRIGLPSHVTRLVGATPALRRAWYLAIAGVVFVGLAATDADAPRQSVLVLLMLAPLVPVFGIALAYGPNADPAYEMQLATPTRGLRLVAIRSFVVISISAVIVTSVALVSAVARPYAAAWLLPALAVTGTSLMLMTWVSPRRASIAAGTSWFVAVLVAEQTSGALAAFTAIGQVTASVVAVVSIGVAVRRRSSFDHLMAAT
ncbi:MAG: zf-HC2 domain-containing protein [Ilumatobacter sp.]|nr:zf-HC2 domain-containing protein [Ilumatobacter sp.]